MNELRTTLRDDLIAAKALIDTPEKFAGKFHAVLSALDESLPPHDEASDVEDRFSAMLVALRAARPGGNLINIRTEPHADVMALFDRAISKASVQS